jgi:hypothetical protein
MGIVWYLLGGRQVGALRESISVSHALLGVFHPPNKDIYMFLINYLESSQ